MNAQTIIRIPAFNGSPAPNLKVDYSTKGGAEILRQRIARIWELAGAPIETWTEPVKGVGRELGGDQSSVWAVRSNMLNGMPR